MPALDPRVAWLDGTVIEESDLTGDEVRYDAGSGTCLVRKGDTITTVVDADTASPGTKQAIDDAIGGASA